MPPSAAHAAAHPTKPTGQTPAGVAFNGTSLSVDYAAYLAQHDLVYLTPPLQGEQAMPIGDGDLGAMVWTPGPLRMQLQKNDLWVDPPAHITARSPGPAALWRQVSAGQVSLHCTPTPLEDPTRFEQRLSLYTGVINLQADAREGSCQITAFAAATAGVLVVHYQDQSLRNAARWVEVSLWRDAQVFALGETIGILQALPDRRYTLVACIAGKRATARMQDRHTARLEIEPFRSGSFTLYLAIATNHRNGDPITVAKTRLQDALNKGYEALLREHKQHWALFWQKSFLRLSSPGDDPLPGYLENLWYLTLYQLAACSRGYDAPLPNGATWLHGGDARSGPALYEGPALRQMAAPLLPANHLELTVPYIETHYRLLPDLAAQTGRQFGVSGARFPIQFNRFGDSFDAPAEGEEGRAASSGQIEAVSEGAAASAVSTPTEALPALRPHAAMPSDTDSLGDGLAMALFVWEAWRHAPDPMFLRERAYPLLRACTNFALEYTNAHPEALAAPQARAQLAAALRALIWASNFLDEDADQRPDWEAGWRVLAETAPPYRTECLQPFGLLSPDEAAPCLQSWLSQTPQLAQGFFAPDGHTPDLQRSGQLCAGLASLLLREENLPMELGEIEENPGGLLRAFPALPPGWSAAFRLAAPGGFRVCAEANEGRVSYVAVHSLLGGICRIANPWGAGQPTLIHDGRAVVMETSEPILAFETKRSGVYVIEPAGSPLGRSMRMRLTGRRNDSPKRLDDRMLGLDK